MCSFAACSAKCEAGQEGGDLKYVDGSPVAATATAAAAVRTNKGNLIGFSHTRSGMINIGLLDKSIGQVHLEGDYWGY